MGKIQVNAMGDACPIPVVKATRALREMKEPGTLEVLVDNEIAVQNLQRMASGYHFAAAGEKRGEQAFAVTITVSAPLPGDPQEEPAPACVPDQRENMVVAFDTAVMGRGDDKLGAALMKSFVYALGQLPRLPRTLLFYNGGARLTTEGSDVLEDLKTLEAQGVEILTCGTCLNFYGLTEQLKVGGVTNMYSIVEKLAGAEKVLKP